MSTAGLVGCSGKSATFAAPKSLASASARQQVKASAEAKNLLAKAKRAAATARSVHVSGPLTVGKTTLDLDLAVGDTAAGGTVKVAAGKAEVRVIGAEIYVRGDQAFWDGLQKGVGVQFKDRWLRLSPQVAPEFAALAGLVPVTAVLDRLAPEDVGWGQVDGEKVGGAATVGLRAADPSRTDTVLVSAKDPSYPLLLRPTSGGELTFGAWSTKEPHVTAPTENVVDGTRFSLH